MLPLSKSIIITVVYADIFDYPLTPRQIHSRLIGLRVGSKQVLKQLGLLLGKKPGSLLSDGIYITLKGRQKLARQVGRKKLEAQIKTDKVKTLVYLFKFIPSIDMVSLTGGVAAGNAGEDDDIDLFFIVQPGTIWATRLAVILIAEMFGLRRRPKQTKIKNKVCLNMFITADSLELMDTKKDLYTAHEVVLMKPLWSRRQAYRRFINANLWIKYYLPNIGIDKAADIADSIVTDQNIGFILLNKIIIWLMQVMDPYLGQVQSWYMKNKITNEIATDRILMFHPQDIRSQIRGKITSQLKKLNIPLDKVFYLHIK